MRILHAAAEFHGLAKTGGLADMVAALTASLHRLDCDIRVCVPAYTGALARLLAPRPLGRLDIRGHAISVVEGRLQSDGPLLWLLDCPALFDRGDNPYRDASGSDFADNAERFAIFGAAVAQLAAGPKPWRPDVVHLHDWHAALAAAWLAQLPARPGLVFTIHNLQHQGIFDRAIFDALDLPGHWWQIDGVEFHGHFSFMKAGLVHADAITTVSPTYAREIQTPAFGHGLDGLLRARADRLHGIVNGIDTDIWNPAGDSLIPVPYDTRSAARGKAANKRLLQESLGLPVTDRPLVIFIGRLADQKGADLILAARRDILELPIQIALLASGDRGLEQACLDWRSHAPDRVAVALKVDEQLAHRLTAAADLQLMPSRFEPCGLNQMYAQRYGTIPVVRNTGGLADTVVDTTATTLADGSATGVHFEHADVGGVLYGLRRGLALLAEPDTAKALRRHGMQRDFSWEASAHRYLDLYRQA